MKNNINPNTLIVICLSLFSLNACKKQATFDGPSIEELYSSFKLLEDFKADKTTVSFAAPESVTFTAKFSKVVAWTITINGATSKAKKIITGQGKQIDATNALWKGSTTELPMFRAENVTATLSIDGQTTTYSLPIEIKTAAINNGLVIADFETGLLSSWTKFIQSGASMDFGVKDDDLAPQDTKYLKMHGIVNWDWLIGLIDFPASAYGTSKTLPLSTNPDEVYFNCLIYGVANTNESIVLFQFREDENGDGNISGSADDEYDLQVKVNWVGWKLVSIKYTDLPYLNNGQAAPPKGNSQHNPDKIGKISMLHLADPAGGLASTKIDYIIFTQYGPLVP